MTRREIASAIVGLALGVFAAHAAAQRLEASPGWDEIHSKEPRLAGYMVAAFRLPFPIAGFLVGAAAFTFLRVRGVVKREGRTRVPLPEYPYDPHKTQLIVGEVHYQDGSLSDSPHWMIQPEKGMCTGILITGATGSGKTATAHYPFTQQLIYLHPNDPARKLGGLVIDAKGNYSEMVRQWCINAGRADDYYEISLESGVRYNIIGRKDLGARALGGHLADMIDNVQGKGQDPFWHQEAADLASNCIRIIRLATGREPTMADIYRLATSLDEVDKWIAAAEERALVGTPADQEEMLSLKFWKDMKLQSLDPKLRSSIAAGLNGVCSLFDEPAIKSVFCPSDDEANFLGFDALLERGLIVCLKIPRAELKTVADIVGTLTKLNFYDAVLQRLSKATRTNDNADVGRVLFMCADEFDCYLTQPADGNLLAKSREAKLCAIIATQSMESIVSKLRGNEHMANQLTANLRTKIWLCCEDYYTAKAAADLCGEEEREKVTLSFNESGKGSYSYTDGKMLSTERDSIQHGTSISQQREHLFPPREFTRLRLNEAIVKLFDGIAVHPPTHVYLKPYYEDPDVSWFDSPAGKAAPPTNNRKGT